MQQWLIQSRMEVLMIYTTQIYTTYVISTYHHSPSMFWSFILVQLADFVFVFPVGLIIGLCIAVAVTNSSEGRPLLAELATVSHADMTEFRLMI